MRPYPGIHSHPVPLAAWRRRPILFRRRLPAAIERFLFVDEPCAQSVVFLILPQGGVDYRIRRRPEAENGTGGEGRRAPGRRRNRFKAATRKPSD